MAETTEQQMEKKSSGKGKFWLGAALGAVAGAIAGHFISKNVEVDMGVGDECDCGDDCKCNESKAEEKTEKKAAAKKEKKDAK